MSKHYRNCSKSMDDISMKQQTAEIESDSEEEMPIRNMEANTEEEVAVSAKRRRQEPNVKHPLMCRACGKIFTDTSNCRRHEKSHVCCRSKPSYEVKTCIANNFLYLNDHLNNVYADIAARMESVLGVEAYEKNKFFLIESSMNLMARTLCSERLNLIASLKTVEKQEKNKRCTL